MSKAWFALAVIGNRGHQADDFNFNTLVKF